MNFLLDYVDSSSLLSIYDFFEMVATQLVEDPSAADVLVTDEIDIAVAGNAEVIRSCDVEKILALMNTV